ncbi:hypothetical protein JNB11_00465 [Kocuria palustris]|nr:hypothetical protein [Kocuria palustris]
MPPKQPPLGAPFTHRVVVSTLAVLAGIWVIKSLGSDFQWVKFEPHPPEEIERRQRENVPLKMLMADERTLEYTPEARKRFEEGLAKKRAEAEANEKS